MVTVLAVDVLPFVPVPASGFCVSVTVSEKVYVAGVLGAVNVGFCAVVLESVTAGPAVWLHAYEMACAWVCDEPEPSRVTVPEPTFTVCAVPALATGRFAKVLAYAASAVFVDAFVVLIFVTTTLYVGQFADVALTAPVPLVHAEFPVDP